MELFVRWMTVLLSPTQAFRPCTTGKCSGFSDALTLVLIVAVVLYARWVVQAVLIGYDIGITAGFFNLAFLLRAELLPQALALGALFLGGLILSWLAGGGGSVGTWLDLSGLAFTPIPVARVVGDVVRLIAGMPRLRPGQIGTEWAVGGFWAAGLVLWAIYVVRMNKGAKRSQRRTAAR